MKGKAHSDEMNSQVKLFCFFALIAKNRIRVEFNGSAPLVSVLSTERDGRVKKYLTKIIMLDV